MLVPQGVRHVFLTLYASLRRGGTRVSRSVGHACSPVQYVRRGRRRGKGRRAEGRGGDIGELFRGGGRGGMTGNQRERGGGVGGRVIGEPRRGEREGRGRGKGECVSRCLVVRECMYFYLYTRRPSSFIQTRQPAYRFCQGAADRTGSHRRRLRRRRRLRCVEKDVTHAIFE